jgi:hypothetical protein
VFSISSNRARSPEIGIEMPATLIARADEVIE